MTTATRKTADERREQILEAARDEFALKGLYGASTDLIARKAGISWQCGTYVRTVCIESAARSARDLGYMPLVVGDACAAETPEVHVATLQRLNAIFAPVVSTQTAIELVRKAATAGRLRSRPGTTA